MSDSHDLSALEDTTRTVVRAFKTGMMTDESKCKQYAIVPVLEALGWDPRSPELIPEYKLEDSDGPRWVDYALCEGGPRHPKVFVEAKGPRGVTRPENKDQLFEYGSNQGVPLLVLTDGDTWRLYFAFGEGPPTEREFDTVRLTEEPDGLARLNRALSRDLVISGDARRYAEHQQMKRRYAAKARAEIPRVWRNLVTSEGMVNMLFEKVREDTKWEPLIEDVRAFLKGRGGAIGEYIGKAEVESDGLRSAVQAKASAGRGGTIDKERAREMLAQGMSQSEVARHFRVAPSSVGAMVRRDKELQAPERSRQTSVPSAGGQRDAQLSGRAPIRNGRIDKHLARQMLARGRSQTEVAHYFGVTPSSVSAMVRKDRQRHE